MIRRALSLNWLTGPIFDKDLRVAGRQRRNYILRSAYVLLLSLFVILVWNAAIDDNTGASALTRSRMAMAGRSVVMTVVLFQFAVTQLLAVILMSTSISGEVYHKTLGVLMTTPTTSLQIVMGKLLSGLWQLIVLLLISLPLLAIVRVMGGIPWDYLIAGLGITLTSILFAGSLSLFMSINNRQSYVVILSTLFILGLYYLIIPWLIALFLHRVVNDDILLKYLFLPNPLGHIGFQSAMLLEPSVTAATMMFPWYANSAILLGITAALLFLAVRRVRRVALAQMTGQAQIPARKNRKPKSQNAAKAADTALSESSTAAAADSPVVDMSSIRRVGKAPVLWKELRTPILRSRKSRIGFILICLLMIVSYLAFIADDNIDDEGPHVMYGIIFTTIGLFYGGILSATIITAEKESRAWPILLASPLSSRDILRGKLLGLLRRMVPVWIFPVIHLIIFSLVGIIHPITIVLYAILFGWITVFLCSTGLFFSTIFQKTTTAVAANLILGLTIWLVIPLLLMFWGETGAFQENVCEEYIMANPVVQAGVIMSATADYPDKSLHDISFYWPNNEHKHPFETFFFLIMVAGSYCFLGMIFLLYSHMFMRRKIF